MNSMDRPTDQGSRLMINGLEEVASKPDVDPCDVACEACRLALSAIFRIMALNWLLEHTDDATIVQAGSNGTTGWAKL